MKAAIPFRIAITMIRLFLGALFLYVAIDKILEPHRFALVIYNYRILPVELTNLAAIIVPWLEITIGLCLLLDIWRAAAAQLLCVIMFSFIVMIFSAMARRLNIACGCFALDDYDSVVGWSRILEDVLMFIGGLCIIWYDLKTRKTNA